MAQWSVKLDLPGQVHASEVLTFSVLRYNYAQSFSLGAKDFSWSVFYHSAETKLGNHLCGMENPFWKLETNVVWDDLERFLKEPGLSHE